MDISFVTVLKFIYFICSSPLILADVVNFGKCADSQCSEPIALGTAIHDYYAIDNDKLNLISGEKVEIFVRDYGKKKELFGIKLKGKMGFVPKIFIKEETVKVSTLVPASLKFGHLQENPNHVTDQGSPQLLQQDKFNPILDTNMNTQVSMQDHQVDPHLGSGKSLGSIENFQVHTSQKEQPPSTGGYFDPQLLSTTQQQAHSVPTHIPQVSDLLTSNTHQQFSDLRNVQFPQHQGELNSPSLQPGSSLADNFQHPVSERANIAQQPAESALPSQNPSMSNAQTQQLYSTQVEQATHSQFNPPQQQIGQLDSGIFQGKQYLDTLQASFSSQYYDRRLDYSFPASSFNSEINSANSFPTSPQINSALPNNAPEFDPEDPYFLREKNLKEQPNYPPSSYYGTQNENNQYQDTASLLRNQGLDYDDFTPDYGSEASYDLPGNQYGFDSYNQGGYSSEISNSHHYNQPSRDLFHQNNVNPSLKPIVDNAHGIFRQDLGQKNVPDGLSHTPSFDPSFHATSTQLKLDHPSAHTEIKNTFNTMDSQKLDSSEESTQMHKNNEEDFDEGEVQIETVDTDAEVMHDKNMENVNGVESDQLEKDLNSKQDEVPSIEAGTQSVNSASPSTQISNTNEPNMNINTHEPSTHANRDEPSTHTNTDESIAQTSAHELSLQTNTHDQGLLTNTMAQTNAHEPSTQTQATEYTHNNYSSEDNEAAFELNSVNESKLNNSDDFSNQTVNIEVSTEVQSSKTEESKPQVSLNFVNNSEIESSNASPSQSLLDIAISKDPTEVHGESDIENHVEKVKESDSLKEEIEQVTQMPYESAVNKSFAVETENESAVGNESQLEVNELNSQDTTSKEETDILPNIIEEKHIKVPDFQYKDSEDSSTSISSNATDTALKKELESVDQKMNVSETIEVEDNSYLNPYQIRNLKEDQEASENVESSDELNENATYPEEDDYSMIENSLEAIRSFMEAIIPWIPEPLYSIIMDLENKGISPRVTVFTALCSLPSILLILALVLIKEKSKEKYLTVLLAAKEKGVFTLEATNVALEEKLQKTTAELESSKNMLDEERKTFDSMKKEVGSLKEQIDKAKQELENSADDINTLKEREKEFMELIKDHEKIHLDLMEEKSVVDKKVADQEDEINRLSDQVEEKENEISLLQAMIEKYKQSSEDYEEKLNQLQTNCNQLLKEAEVWNIRVNELNSKLSEESTAKEELEKSLELKESEVKSLTHLVQTLKSFEDIDSGNEDEQKSNEEKLKCLMDSSKVLIQLQKQEEENNILAAKLSEAQNKILEIEVQVLESKSENDKIKLNYNQALQDKTEATTKLEVLTNYFKDKEIQLQKQLGAQEAFRERREKDADSAERQIVLIEKENASYKSQVASMKQEMEETERNLKAQIATQEKKAHENWIAARAAERKLEDMKQEVTQLRQRLTLLEREQENWTNSPRDDIIRPIPKRISGINDDPSLAPEMNNSMDPRHIFPPPPPMMLPPDRPLPPLPPLPPFLPPLEPPPFRPQPWHLPSEPGSDFRMTPPDFMRRELTPPRGRHSAIIDGDMGPMQSSPLGGDMRESRNSTPPHNLPSFHDIPPPPPRPFFPPPPHGHHPRYPPPPAYRRDFPPGHKRIDSQSDNSSTGRGTQPTPSSQEHYPHNSRV